MAIHMTPDELADALGVEPHVVVNAAREVDVPVYQGRIDSVLLREALVAGGHHLAPRAEEALRGPDGR